VRNVPQDYLIAAATRAPPPLLIEEAQYRASLDGVKLDVTPLELRLLSTLLAPPVECFPAISCETRSTPTTAWSSTARWTVISAICGASWNRRAHEKRPFSHFMQWAIGFSSLTSEAPAKQVLSI
jgi:hypothetical protein